MMEFAPIIVRAERVLSHTLGREVRLADVSRLSEDDRRIGRRGKHLGPR